MVLNQTYQIIYLAYFLKVGLNFVLWHDVMVNGCKVNELMWIPFLVFTLFTMLPHEVFLVIGVRRRNYVLIHIWKICCLFELLMLMLTGILIVKVAMNDDTKLVCKFNIILPVCFLSNVMICQLYMVANLVQNTMRLVEGEQDQRETLSINSTAYGSIRRQRNIQIGRKLYY